MSLAESFWADGFWANEFWQDEVWRGLRRRQRGAGSSRRSRPRRRVVVEIDGQLVDVRDESQALDMLENLPQQQRTVAPMRERRIVRLEPK